MLRISPPVPDEIRHIVRILYAVTDTTTMAITDVSSFPWSILVDPFLFPLHFSQNSIPLDAISAPDTPQDLCSHGGPFDVSTLAAEFFGEELLRDSSFDEWPEALGDGAC